MSTTTIPYSKGPKAQAPRLRAACAALVLGSLIVLPPVATSEMYQYVDKNGTVTATNVPPDSILHRFDRAGRVRIPTQVTERELDQAIRWFARQHRLSPALLRAIIKAESDFNPGAVSPTGAIGLMQLMPRTAASLNIHDPFNPVENIRGGAKHFRYLLDRFEGNLPLAIAAYNAGEYRVKRNNYQIPPIQETRDYVEKVLAYYDSFRSVKRVSGAKAMF